VATHSVRTNLNLSLMPYCVCLALQTDCLTCSSVHGEANKNPPTNNKLLDLYNFCKIMLALILEYLLCGGNKKELRASRQYSAECHRTTHKGNTLKKETH